MANSFPGSGLAYADAFSVGTANSVNSSLYVCSSCVQATRIEHIYSQTGLHQNTLWLRANNSGARAGASIGFTVVNNGGDHHRANIEATANSGQIGGNLALYTRNNNGNDQLGLYIDNVGNVGIGGITNPSKTLHVYTTGNEGIFLQGSGGGVWMDIQASGGQLHSIGAQVGGMGIYNRTCSSYRFFITDVGKVGIGTTSPIGDVKTDIRTSSPLTAEVGQPLFVGSNDVIGPLGVVIQHLCGHGVCRVDFTSTRYGVSGNDLSLNVDSSNPNTGGGLYIKYRGNVGISTSSPCTKLSIKCSTGGIKVDLLSLTTTDGAGSQPTLRFDTVEANCNVLGRISVCDIAPYAGAMIFEASGCKGAGSATTTELMRLVGTTGNVGIGTSSPSSRLDVSGADGRIQSRVDGSDGSTINVRPNAGKCGWISYTEDAVADRWGIGIKNGDGALYFASGNVGAGGGTTRMALTSTGAIGLGTASPASRFHITHTGAEGACTIILQSTNSCGNGTISWRTSAGVTQAQIGSNYNVGDNGGNLELITAGNTRLLVTSAGSIGINTSSPIDKFEVAGGIHTSGTAAASKACSGYLDYYLGQVRLGITGPNITSPAIFRIDQYSSNASIICTPFYITETSNVGVNTTSPSYRLHVNGTFYAAGSSVEYKDQIYNYDTDSCLFMCLKPVTYQYKNEWKHLGKELKSETQIGLIAEHVAEVMPELAILIDEDNNKVVRNVDYEKLSIVLLSEVQKLRREVDNLKNDN